MHIFTLWLVHSFCTVREVDSGFLQRVNCIGYTLKKQLGINSQECGHGRNCLQYSKGHTLVPHSFCCCVCTAEHPVVKRKAVKSLKAISGFPVLFFLPHQYDYKVNPFFYKQQTHALILHLRFAVKGNADWLRWVWPSYRGVEDVHVKLLPSSASQVCVTPQSQHRHFDYYDDHQIDMTLTQCLSYSA